MSGTVRDATATLRRAVAGRASMDDGKAAVFALLAAADEPPRAAPRTAAAGAERGGYDAAITGAFEGLDQRLDERAALRRRADELARRIEEVRRVSPVEALRLALEPRPPLTAATVKALVRRSDRLALEVPADAVALSRVAVAIAEAAARSTPAAAATIDLADLQANAHRALAEAAFRAGDLIEAVRALVRARAAFALGSLAPALDGDLHRVESEIRSDQSRFAEARRLAERAVALYRRAGDRQSEARATISLALKWYYEGELERALATTAQGLALLDPVRDGRLRLAAEFNRVFWWNDAGRHAEARAALPALAASAERDGSAGDRLRLAWLEARIVAGEGDLAGAIVLYQAVLARSLELDIVYDSATVAFELASHLLELGRTAEVLPIAETVARIFATQGVAPEAAAAVLLAADVLRQGVAAHEALRLLLARGRIGRDRAR